VRLISFTMCKHQFDIQSQDETFKEYTALLYLPLVEQVSHGYTCSSQLFDHSVIGAGLTNVAVIRLVTGRSTALNNQSCLRKQENESVGCR
jgi:hypothetical protein